MEKNPEYQPLARKISEGIPFDRAMEQLKIPAEQGVEARKYVLKILADRQTDELLLHEVAIDGIRTATSALKNIIEGGERYDEGGKLGPKGRDTDLNAAKALLDASVRLKALIRGSTTPVPENAQKDIFGAFDEAIILKGPWKLKDPGV